MVESQFKCAELMMTVGFHGGSPTERRFIVYLSRKLRESRENFWSRKFMIRRTSRASEQDTVGSACYAAPISQVLRALKSNKFQESRSASNANLRNPADLPPDSTARCKVNVIRRRLSCGKFPSQHNGERYGDDMIGTSTSRVYWICFIA